MALLRWAFRRDTSGHQSSRRSAARRPRWVHRCCRNPAKKHPRLRQPPHQPDRHQPGHHRRRHYRPPHPYRQRRLCHQRRLCRRIRQPQPTRRCHRGHQHPCPGAEAPRRRIQHRSAVEESYRRWRPLVHLQSRLFHQRRLIHRRRHRPSALRFHPHPPYPSRRLHRPRCRRHRRRHRRPHRCPWWSRRYLWRRPIPLRRPLDHCRRGARAAGSGHCRCRSVAEHPARRD